MRVFFLTAALVLISDIVSKVIVVAQIKQSEPGVRLLGGAVYLVQARNSGAAFSVGTGATVMLTAISVVVAVVIVRAARRLTSTWWAIALGLVLGGALGNLIDRFFRAPAPGKGHVVDWISLFANDGHVWPIFNIADSSIVIGGAIAVILSIFGIDFYGKRNPLEQETGLDEASEPPVTPEVGSDTVPEDHPASSDTDSGRGSAYPIEPADPSDPAVKTTPGAQDTHG
jgi:signal peptidase II